MYLILMRKLPDEVILEQGRTETTASVVETQTLPRENVSHWETRKHVAEGNFCWVKTDNQKSF